MHSKLGREDRIKIALDADPPRLDPKTAQIIRPILDDLAAAGFPVQSFHQLRHQGKSWEAALPVLQKWLPLVDEEHIKSAIVSCLSVPWIKNRATGQLIDEFKKADSERGLGWSIGNALSIVSVKGFEREILNLCLETKYGKARQMIVWSLKKVNLPEAEDVALALLEDHDVWLHAIIALGKMKSKRALPHLEKLLIEKAPGIAREASKAIAKINR